MAGWIRTLVGMVAGFKQDLVGTSMTAEVDDLRTLLVELSQEVKGPGARNQDDLQPVAEGAEPDFLGDLAELAGKVEWSGPADSRRTEGP